MGQDCTTLIITDLGPQSNVTNWLCWQAGTVSQRNNITSSLISSHLISSHNIVIYTHLWIIPAECGKVEIIRIQFSFTSFLKESFQFIP